MPRHSKNSTALGFFTHAERSKLQYGIQRQRLGRDSMKDFDACFLCLQKAIEPVCCYKGHIYCKECILENILAQKKEISRSTQLTAQLETSKELQESLKATEERERAVGNFKRLEGTISQDVSKSSDDNKKISNFWLPSLTPEASISLDAKVEKSGPLCFAVEKAHTISVKKLVPIKFSTSASEKNCPSCLTAFRNGVKIVVLKGCGHALCKACCTKFVKSSKRCMVCETECKESDILDLHLEGTGFSSSGKVEAAKAGPAFQ